MLFTLRIQPDDLKGGRAKYLASRYGFNERSDFLIDLTSPPPDDHVSYTPDRYIALMNSMSDAHPSISKCAPRIAVIRNLSCQL